MPNSSDSAGSLRQAITALRYSLPQLKVRRHPELFLTKLNRPAGTPRSLSTLRSLNYSRSTQDSLSTVANLIEWNANLAPLGLLWKVSNQNDSVILFIPFPQALPGAI
jgi:hypothetical protein